VVPDGQTIPVFSRVSPTEERLFLLTNHGELLFRYIGLLLHVRETLVGTAGGPWSRIQISTDGGEEPFSAPDGRTLYFRRYDSDSIMAVPIRTEGVLETGRPRVLFERRYACSDPAFSPTPNWDVASDGRFLMIRPSDEELPLRRSTSSTTGPNS
jgi:hypothetical protein